MVLLNVLAPAIVWDVADKRPAVVEFAARRVVPVPVLDVSVIVELSAVWPMLVVPLNVDQ